MRCCSSSLRRPHGAAESITKVSVMATTGLCFRAARQEQKNFARWFEMAANLRKWGDVAGSAQTRRWAYQHRGWYTWWGEQVAKDLGRDPKKVFAYFRLTREVSNA